MFHLKNESEAQGSQQLSVLLQAPGNPVPPSWMLYRDWPGNALQKNPCPTELQASFHAYQSTVRCHSFFSVSLLSWWKGWFLHYWQTGRAAGPLPCVPAPDQTMLTHLGVRKVFCWREKAQSLGCLGAALEPGGGGADRKKPCWMNPARAGAMCAVQ